MSACADQKPLIDVRSVLVMTLSPAGGWDRCPPLAELRSPNLKSNGLELMHHRSKACLLLSMAARNHSFTLLDGYLAGESIN